MVLLSIIIFSGALIKNHLQPNQYMIERLNIAEDISHLVPEGEKIAAFWPGLFSHFSNHPIVPLDGIIGSDEYFTNYVKTGKEIDYMREHNVKYLVLYCHIGLDQLLRCSEIKTTDWTMLGIERLWENRQYIVKTLKTRLINTQGAGWYLIEIAPKSDDGNSLKSHL